MGFADIRHVSLLRVAARTGLLTNLGQDHSAVWISFVAILDDTRSRADTRSTLWVTGVRVSSPHTALWAMQRRPSSGRKETSSRTADSHFKTYGPSGPFGADLPVRRRGEDHASTAAPFLPADAVAVS